jgi:hypothetical protein
MLISYRLFVSFDNATHDDNDGPQFTIVFVLLGSLFRYLAIGQDSVIIKVIV